MHSLIRSILALGFLVFANPVIAQALEYRFSFEEQIQLQPGGTRVTLTVTNPSDSDVECEIAALLDNMGPDPVRSRVIFQPVEGSTDCLGGGCAAIVSPPPRIALWASVGPFAPGESKTCEFDIHAVDPFSEDITLIGNAGPIRVFPLAFSVPTLSHFGILLLLMAMLSSALLLARRANA